MQGSLSELDHRLRSAGYRPGSPSAEIAAADAGVCARIACSDCLRAGLDYRPYVGASGNGRLDYRPLAVCDRCGRAEEF